MLNHEFPIAVAALRSGLSQHVIRAWEKRYAAIVPSRSGTKRRLYSASEIQRLTLLRDATLAGHSIGNIASLPNDALRALATENRKPATRLKASTPAEEFLTAAWNAVGALDSQMLDRLLLTGAVSLGRNALIQKVVVPLIERIGEEWKDGTLRVAYEHLATNVIRTFLSGFVHAHSATSNAPVLVLATPPGQLHELGALIAGSIATDHGWRVVYLGASLPPEEIARAVEQTNADALALSIVYPADDDRLAAQLHLIRRLLPKLPILVGGRSACGYQAELEKISAKLCGDLSSTVQALDDVRNNRHR